MTANPKHAAAHVEPILDPPSRAFSPGDSTAEALRLRYILISQFGLDKEKLAEISGLQLTQNIDFGEAVIRLQYVRREDVEQLRARIKAPRAHEARVPDFRAVARRSRDTREVEGSGEQLRALRTELLVRHRSRAGANVLAVVSPCRSEGRSHLAADLAASFSQLGQPTLLIDADLRRPTQHLLYGQDNTDGLANAIAEGRPARLHPVGPGDLMLVTAGHNEANPVELLSSGMFEKLMSSWAQRFDHIIFDSPPAVEFPDALALADAVGRILPLSRAQYTPMKATREMFRRFESTRAETVGAVLGHY